MNSRLCLIAVCAALAGPALTSRPALAQDIDAAALARHRAAFERGNKFLDAGQLQQAEVAYLEAWRIKKSYDVAGNLATVEADLGKARNAAEHFAYALHEFPAGGKPVVRDALIRRLADVQRRVGAVRLQVNRPGAEVYIDGQLIGMTPLPTDIYLDPGVHLLETRLAGYAPAQVNLSAERGSSQEVTLTLASSSGNFITYTGIGLAVAGAVAGGVFTGLSVSKANSATTLVPVAAKQGGCGDPTKAPPTQVCKDLKSALDNKAAFANAALWSFVGAAAVGVGTAVYAFTGAGSRGSQTGLVLVPVVTATDYGVVVGGVF